MVTYACDGAVATIRLDDGRRNALSPDVLAAIGDALDRAERDAVPVLLVGREGTFSAGFDLEVMRRGGYAAWKMVLDGFRLAVRLLEHPQPVVIACTGHAVAMGCFLLLAADERVGQRGDFKIQANEVAIGLPLPFTALGLCQMRLTPEQLQRATLLSHTYSPEEAVGAGFLDRVADDAAAEGRAIAETLGALDARAHLISKRRARKEALRGLKRAIWKDSVDLVWQGARAVHRVGNR